MRKKISLDVENSKDDEKCAEIRFGQLHFSCQVCRKQVWATKEFFGEKKTPQTFFLKVFIGSLSFIVSL